MSRFSQTRSPQIDFQSFPSIFFSDGIVISVLPPSNFSIAGHKCGIQLLADLFSFPARPAHGYT